MAGNVAYLTFTYASFEQAAHMRSGCPVKVSYVSPGFVAVDPSAKSLGSTVQQKTL